MSFYADAAAVAVELLTDFGQSMTLRHFPDVPASGYFPRFDTEDGEISKGTPADYTMTGVFLPSESDAEAKKANTLGATMTERSLGTVTIPASGLAVTPAPSDLVQIGSDWWTVTNVTTISPAGTGLIHKLEVRR